MKNVIKLISRKISQYSAMYILQKFRESNVEEEFHIFPDCCESEDDLT